MPTTPTKPVDAAPVVPPSLSDAAKALDQFDQMLAPVWKLPNDKLGAAMCDLAKTLQAKADTLKSLAAPPGVKADDWKSTIENVSGTMGGVMLDCFNGRPTKMSPEEKTVQDGNDRDAMKAVHDAFAAAVKLVPDAHPIDSHANDPLPTATVK